MPYTCSADGLQGVRLMFDTPSHEGNERVRAEIPSDPGRHRRWEDDLRGSEAVEGEQTDVARLACPGRFPHPPGEVLCGRICRLNGVEHLLTQPRMPTTTGKVERFHRTLRVEFDTTQAFTNLKTAQGALDEWVAYYNTGRTHQSLGDATPASRFQASAARPPTPERNGEQWLI